MNADAEDSGWAVFQPISHPVLHSVDPVKVAQFITERERYEIEVDEKSKEVEGLTKANCRASIDPGLLRRIHCLGKLKNIAPKVKMKNLTDKQIEKWIQSFVDQTLDNYNPA